MKYRPTYMDKKMWFYDLKTPDCFLDANYVNTLKVIEVLNICYCNFCLYMCLY